jgi:predicted 3-demethylubiquinone-9 3-methyltransferase (glyoxalase superfamily)
MRDAAPRPNPRKAAFGAWCLEVGAFVLMSIYSPFNRQFIKRRKEMAATQKITPFLWFDKEAGEAARFYVSVFKGSRIKGSSILKNTPSGTVEIVTVELFGQEFTLMSAGPFFKFNESISFVVPCKTQKEIDYYWEKLSADPKAEQCGWLKDRYGLSWQIVPTILAKMQKDKDPKKVARVTEAFLKMKKFDIAALKKAYDG